MLSDKRGMCQSKNSRYSVTTVVLCVAVIAFLLDAESQLQSHMRICMNFWLKASLLRQLINMLAEKARGDKAQRASEALNRILPSWKEP